MEKNFNWGNMYNDLKTALDNGYTRFYVGFYMVNYGCQAGCAEWARLSNSQKQSIKNLLSQYQNPWTGDSARIYLSVGGPGEFWEDCIEKNCAAAFGQEAGAYAAQQMFDGVDMDVKLAGEGTVPSSYANDGSFLQSVQDLSSNIRSSGGYDRDHMSLSSNAPYFSALYYSQGISQSISTLALTSNQNQPWAIYDCNMMMFNEDGNYMTETDIFFNNNYTDPIYSNFGMGSSAKEVFNQGMNVDQQAIIKPITMNEPTVRNGYIAPSTLHTWACNAHVDWGFQGGFVGWTWNTATEDEKNTVMSWVTSNYACDN